jgi:hypothetical protein
MPTSDTPLTAWGGFRARASLLLGVPAVLAWLIVLFLAARTHSSAIYLAVCAAPLESGIECARNWLTALATPLLAGFGIYIAYRQWRTAREKVKLDLFDRRLVALQEMRRQADYSYLGPIGEDQLSDIQRTAEFSRTVGTALYLFPSPAAQEKLGFVATTLSHVFREIRNRDSPFYRDASSEITIEIKTHLERVWLAVVELEGIVRADLTVHA